MLLYSDTLCLLLAALLLDAIIGDPDVLWRRLPHPVVMIGKVIGLFDKLLNRNTFASGRRKANGILVLVMLVLGAFLLGLGLDWLARQLPWGEALIVLIAAVFLAQKSLYQHVAAVCDGLQNDGLEGGRRAVAMIVGRDPKQLDEAGVSRAAIESCAENFSDGVIAPALWFALLGLPGLLAYKAINTADSMIGHKNKTYADFGWASARFDDLINLPASRLSGILVAFAAPLVGGSVSKAFRTIRQDAQKHRSPNAGWPEAAMAGALDIAIAGPRAYPGYTVNDPFINESGQKQYGAAMIDRALKLLSGSCVLLGLLIVSLAIAHSLAV